jgi:hypothetical protein
MLSTRPRSLRVGTQILLSLGLTCTVATLAWGHHRAPALPQAPDALAATIFTYDGHEFLRAKSTLVTEAGKSAVNTQLEHTNPAFKALLQKHSYSGEAVVFGKHYDANYAPLMARDGHLTGALFVAVPK